MCTEKWNSLDAIRRVNVPTLIMVGTHDTMVPPIMSEQLFEVCPCPSRCESGRPVPVQEPSRVPNVPLTTHVPLNPPFPAPSPAPLPAPSPSPSPSPPPSLAPLPAPSPSPSPTPAPSTRPDPAPHSLRAQAAGTAPERKRLVRIEGGTHNDTILARDYFTQIAAFWNLYIKPIVYGSNY